ncbi:hypothetical protein [Natronolimnohabitans innermongolicus]|uniref:hypothetical protein n=1 Tax=Natronolimnohabitans innermongolicus TaxID=253107 RepID=UPI001375B29A|nr:hypothetical protein [Natronolimnohabitans innermongolicus]
MDFNVFSSDGGNDFQLLRRLPLRDATHELFEAVGIMTTAFALALSLLVVLGGAF